MKHQRVFVTALSALGIALVLVGCARRTVVVREPARPVYVATAPVAPAPVAVVHVQQGPPEPIVETRPRSPGVNYVWTSGYWTYASTGWVWTPGRWMKPPRPKAEWVPGHWARTGNGNTWEYREGYWR